MKAIFFDIDGTLINFGEEKMPKKTELALLEAQKKGHKIFICTGRSKRQVSDYLLQFGFDGMIYSAGACVEYGGRVIQKKCIPVKVLAKMIAYFEAQKICYLIHSSESVLGTKADLRKFCEKFGGDLQVEPEVIPELFGMKALEEPVLDHIEQYDEIETGTFIHSKVSLEELRKVLAPEIKVTASSFKQKETDSGEITQDGVNKATGIQAILMYLNLEQKDSIAFGDGPNDVDMLRFAGIGVAMENAMDEVKSCADIVTAPVTEDGIYEAMKKLEII